MMFTGVWACIRPWLDEKTRQKIHIKGNAKDLLEFVSDFLRKNVQCFLDRS